MHCSKPEAAQSRNVERKPCTVMSPRPIRRRTSVIAMLDSGLPAFPPATGNQKSARRRAPEASVYPESTRNGYKLLLLVQQVQQLTP